MMAENIGEMAANLNIVYESVQEILFNDVAFETPKKKRPDLWESRNARSNNAIVIRNFLTTKNGTNTVQQSPNSTVLAPCDFFLFGRLKNSPREIRFSSQVEIMKTLKTVQMIKPKTEYKNCFEDCSQRGVR